MNEQATQAEIKAIQERLQAMRAGHHAPRVASASLMVEMFPNRLAPASLARNPSLTETAPSEGKMTRAGQESGAERRSPSSLRSGSLADSSTGLSSSSSPEEMRSPAVTTALRHAVPASTEPTQHRMAQPIRKTAQTQVAEQAWAADSRMADSRMADTRATKANPDRSSAAVEQSQQQDALKRLEAKAQQINQLSAAQETAMLELKAIATRLERDRVALELQHGNAYERDTSLPAELSTICEYLATNVPAIERDHSGAFVMTTRAVDLFKAERDAELMAQALRHRNGTTPTRHRQASQPAASSQAVGMLKSLWKQLQAIATGSSAQSSARATRRARMAQVNQYAPSDSEGYRQEYSDYSQDYFQEQSQEQSQEYPLNWFPSESHSYSHRSQSQAPASDSLSYKASAIWLGGAIVARIAADLILASHPGFWIPVVGLMLAPAAIAVYRTTVTPQSSMVWGYRLFLLMMGLLLGGRLL